MSVVSSYGFFGWLIFFCAFQLYTLASILSQAMLAVGMSIPLEIISLGFGPRAFGFRRSSRNGTQVTDWRLSAIPFGGYARFESNSFLQADPLLRAVVAFVGPLATLALGFLVLNYSHLNTSAYSGLVAVCGKLGIGWGLFNLLPIPMLNGGHILIWLVELVFGEISLSFKEGLFKIGFVVLWIGMPLGIYWLFKYT